ncbi:hypothetical protein [Marivita sp.]|uniref:hypothetical protein n=1 Tax=Marivita sp. TaxID=2003365 RepID=UPI003A8C46CA
MQLLSTKNVYDVEADSGNKDFLRLVQNPPEGIVVLDGNAGLGADWPAAIWQSASAAAIALSIIGAPSTIEENWPKWLAIYESVRSMVLDFHGEYRVDRDTAQVLAMHHAVQALGLEADTLEIHLAVRHYFTTVAGYEDLLATERVMMDWPDHAEYGSPEFSLGVKSNEEAAKQAICRYVFGVKSRNGCFTVVVESNGKISYSEPLVLEKQWG